MGFRRSGKSSPAPSVDRTQPDYGNVCSSCESVMSAFQHFAHRGLLETRLFLLEARMCGQSLRAPGLPCLKTVQKTLTASALKSSTGGSIVITLKTGLSRKKTTGSIVCTNAAETVRTIIQTIHSTDNLLNERTTNCLNKSTGSRLQKLTS